MYELFFMTQDDLPEFFKFLPLLENTVPSATWDLLKDFRMKHFATFVYTMGLILCSTVYPNVLKYSFSDMGECGCNLIRLSDTPSKNKRCYVLNKLQFSFTPYSILYQECIILLHSFPPCCLLSSSRLIGFGDSNDLSAACMSTNSARIEVCFRNLLTYHTPISIPMNHSYDLVCLLF